MARKKTGPIVLLFEYGSDKTSAWVLTNDGAHKVHASVVPLFDTQFVERETVEAKPSRDFIRETHSRRFGSKDLTWSTRLDAEAA